MICVKQKKGEWIFILKNKLLYYTKKSMKFIIFLIIAFCMIAAVVCLKYKPIYKVTYLGETAGYVQNKKSFEKMIEDEIFNPNEKNVAFVTLDSLPSFELKLVDKSINTDEEKIIAKIKENSETTYEMYAVTLDGVNKSYANTLEEAEEVVNKLKSENKSKNELNLAISQVYTTNLDELNSVQVAETKNNVSNNAKKVVSSNSNTFEGVCFSTKPVSGTITSRFGNKESIRTSAHKGIDIGAPNGTQIKAASDGTVTFARIYYRWIWKPCCYISWK